MRRNRRIISGKGVANKISGRAIPAQDDRERFLRIVGIILVSTMILGVCCSVWFGWKIRDSLSDLESEKLTGSQLQENSRLLKERRSQLMTREVIEKKASVLGLLKPGAKQVIRP